MLNRKKIASFLNEDRAPNPNAIKAVRGADGAADELWIYDAIDPYWGISASQIVKDLKGLTGAKLTVRINSPGGDVFEARAIKTAIEQHPAEVTAQIDGLAASAATTIMLAANNIVAADGAFVMIHNCWSWAVGNKTEIRQTADLLEKIDGQIAADYAKKTGASLEQIVQWMDSETWFTAAEAKEAKFIDSIFDAQPASNSFDLTEFKHAPKALIDRHAEDGGLDEQAQSMKARQIKRLKLYAG